MGDEKNVYVKDIMTRKVITASPEDPIFEIIDCFLEKRVNGLPVVDHNGVLCGIITVTNLFHFLDSLLFDDPLNNYLKDSKTTVRDLMTKDVVTVASDAPVREVVHTSLYKNIHAIPVVDNGKIVGIVGKRDILKAGFSLIKKK
jgi:CBS domain-containing protein